MSSVEAISHARYPDFAVHYSNEDAEWVATSPEYPSLSWLAATPSKAIEGLHKLIADVEADLAKERAQQQRAHALAAEAYAARMAGYSRQ